MTRSQEAYAAYEKARAICMAEVGANAQASHSSRMIEQECYEDWVAERDRTAPAPAPAPESADDLWTDQNVTPTEPKT